MSTRSNPMNAEKKKARDVEIRKWMSETIKGFPLVWDWSRKENNRVSTMAVSLPNEWTVFYSFDLPIGFLSLAKPDKIYVIFLPKDCPCRTTTTSRHISALASQFGEIVQLEPEEFVKEWLKHQK